MILVTCYAVSLILSDGRCVDMETIRDVLLIGLPMLVGVSVASSKKELEDELNLCAERFAEAGCDVGRGGAACIGPATRELARLEKLKALLAGTPLPFYIDAVSRLLGRF